MDSVGFDAWRFLDQVDSDEEVEEFKDEGFEQEERNAQANQGFSLDPILYRPSYSPPSGSVHFLQRKSTDEIEARRVSFWIPPTCEAVMQGKDESAQSDAELKKMKWFVRKQQQREERESSNGSVFERHLKKSRNIRGNYLFHRNIGTLLTWQKEVAHSIHH